MNRYNFSQDIVTKDKFPRCGECGSSITNKLHACPGPKVPSYGNRTNLDRNLVNETPFAQIWNNANQEMLDEDDDIDYDPSWDDPDE